MFFFGIFVNLGTSRSPFLCHIFQAQPEDTRNFIYIITIQGILNKIGLTTGMKIYKSKPKNRLLLRLLTELPTLKIYH